MVVTGTSHANAVTQQIPELRAADLVLEPSPKDSAAAIGLACAIIHRREPDAIIGSFAADHVISPVDEFHRVVTEAVITAATGKIVTIGITPTEPSSAFGYIHASESLGIEDAPNAQAVDTFVEKPDAATAQKYLDSGEYTWNAGMFVAPAALMLKHLEANEPELYAGIMELLTLGTPPSVRLLWTACGRPCPRPLSTTLWLSPLRQRATLQWFPVPSAGTMWETSTLWHA